ncbi:hypothetical protein SAMN05660461_4791 [Chitinophaga ginsengisegetis]|uniref:Uncharacterized protein n=1 Tax=Chitinophaga ginsengisegetis TaxID=393003 RepID=A0A1T5P815_9BACT|nr:hypothetical protein SAMN05660461_4791 [Chitinophaga ginsengisegetis]
MQPLQYFTREGNVYTKKSQTAFFCLLALLLFGLIVFILYNNPTRGGIVSSLLIGVFAVIIALRVTGKLKIDVNARTISVQPVFFISPTEYRFEDFQNFLISKQSFIVTVNATAAMIMDKNGKRKSVMLHQTMFLTKPLQQVTMEIAGIMGLEEEDIA